MAASTKNRRRARVPNGNTTLERLEHFEAFNKTEGKSPRTVEWYSRVIRYFATYLEAQHCSTQLDHVDVHAVWQFILYLQNRTRWIDHLCHPCPNGNLTPLSIVFTLQQILGHTTLEMVKRYVHLASAHVRVQHRKFSPMDRLNVGAMKPPRPKPNTNERGTGSRSEERTGTHQGHTSVFERRSARRPM